MGFSGGAIVKNPPANAGDIRDASDVGLITGSGKYPGGGHRNPLQYSCLENTISRGVWQATIQYMDLQRVGHNGATNTHNE